MLIKLIDMENKWLNEKENLEKLININKASYAEIGRKYGCSDANIKKQAKKLGIELPLKRKINPSETFNRKKNPKKLCPNCGRVVSSRNKYCNNQCKADYEYKLYIERWHQGKETGTIGTQDVSNHVRRYLFEKYNCSCQECGWNKVNEFTLRVPLQIHHLDGDCRNNQENNLKLLCPNCHSLTENFGSRNKNATRIDKRAR